jgi:RimJ/RimL family protein N-acetyltransferase
MEFELKLREVRDSDLPALFDHQRDPEATRMAAFPARSYDEFLAHWAKIRRDPNALVRTVALHGAVAGNIGSWEQDGQRLVGYWIGREHWGKGVATEALRQFLSVDRHRPLYAHVAVQNKPSIRVLEKCGFAHAGVENGVAIRGGPPVDELRMMLPA